MANSETRGELPPHLWGIPVVADESIADQPEPVFGDIPEMVECIKEAIASGKFFVFPIVRRNVQFAVNLALKKRAKLGL